MENPNEVQLTDAYPSVTNKDINIGSVLALKDEMGNLLGVIGMDVTLEDLTRKTEKMTLRFGGHVELWDNKGVVLVSSSRERLNTKVESFEGQTISSDMGISLTRLKDSYLISKKTEAIGETMVAFIPSGEVNRAIYRTVQSRVLLVTMVMILAFLLTFALVEILILRPLRNMQDQLILSHSENLSFPRLMTVHGSGELKSFAEDYNHLIIAIEKERDELEKIKLLTISSLASLAEIRDFETGMHIVRTQKYVELLAAAYNTIDVESRIPEKMLSIMVQCAPLHDIGKVAIPDAILLKPGRLDSEEFEIMKKHTIYGKDSFSKTNADIGGSEFIDTAINMVYYHHERWDGNGYPEGLTGEEIPIEARIMALADVYDALTTKRVYKDAINHMAAVGIIREGNGTQFDPAVVTAFLKIEGCLERISKLYGD